VILFQTGKGNEGEKHKNPCGDHSYRSDWLLGFVRLGTGVRPDHDTISIGRDTAGDFTALGSV